jgi:hypothetical protein
MISDDGYVSVASEVRQSSIVPAASCAQTTTETVGHRDGSSRGNGAPANAFATAASAGLGRRSASTRPKAQSSTASPPRHHSSVHEKATAPHVPSANAARTCIAVSCAWPSSPSRTLSAPASASSSGFAPATCCSRAR